MSPSNRARRLIHKSALWLPTILLSICMLPVGASEAQLNQPLQFSIAAQSLSSALLQFAKQTKIQVLTASEDLDGYRTSGVRGRLTARAALEAILAGTDLSFRDIGKDTVTIRRPQAGPKPAADAAEAGRRLRLALAQTESAQETEERDTSSSSGASATVQKSATGEASVPEILVEGSRVLNMDIQRSRDDVQPYVIFTRSAIEQSGVTNLEEFLKQRLPMNSQGATYSQAPTTRGNASTINLRGLGSSQTLVLVDGHRTISAFNAESIVQGDLNGIPLAAIERIEVLPTTSSGIYGGSATGGVVNVILRRDYVGAEMKVTYGNTFDTDASTRRIDLSAGYTLEDGRTSLLFAGSYSDANTLVAQDRDVYQRGRAGILANNPGFYLDTAFPPLGATTNVRSLDGSPLFGSGTPSITFVPPGYAGGGGLAPLAANAGEYNLDLADQVYFTGARQSPFVNTPTIESLSFTARRKFSSRVHAFIELAGSNNLGVFHQGVVTGVFTVAANAPNNPFGQDIRVSVPGDPGDGLITSDFRDRRVVGGVIVSLPHAWKVEADYTWNRLRNYRTSPNALSPTIASSILDGTIDVLRDTSLYPVDFASGLQAPETSGPFLSTLRDVTVRLAGPIASLPGGELMLSALLEHRDEDFTGAVVSSFFFIPGRSQSVDSAYLEALLPLVSARNRVRGIESLDLQLAARHDEYEVNGSTGFVLLGTPTPVERVTNRRDSTNPTIGLKYQPVRDLILRGSYGTGFVAPSTKQLLPNAPTTGSSIVDPLRGNMVTGVFELLTGGNPELRPEKSTSWSAGFVLTPQKVPGFRLSVDYTRIHKTDNIATLDQQTLVNNESILSGRVVRGANLPTDQPGWAGPIASIDRTSVNVAQAKVEAYDAQLDYQNETAAAGTFAFFAIATLQTHYETQLISTAALTENAGISNANPLKLKGNFGITWQYRPLTLGWTARYFDSYLVADPSAVASALVILNQGSQSIPSQMYHDIFMRYRFSENLLSGIEVLAGIKNLFDKTPPFDASFQYGYYSPFGDADLMKYYVSLKKNF